MSKPTTGPERASTGFSDGLGFLRGLAALVVVVFHCMLVFRFGSIDDGYLQPVDLRNPWLTIEHIVLAVFNGPACVIVFFVLSGVVLSVSLSREPRIGHAAIAGYWIKRGFRLYPLLIAAAGVGALLQYYYFEIATHAAASTWLNSDYKFEQSEVRREFFKNALGLSSSLNSPAWSIKVEIVASALFPVLYVLARRTIAAVVTFLVLLSAMFGWPSDVDSLADLHVFLLCFFVGALIPVNGRWLAERFYGLHAWVQRGLLLAALLTLMFASRLIAPGVHASPTVVVVETTAAAFLITTVFFGPERKFYRLWPSRTLGEVSYGVYLLHLLILNVVARALLPLFPAPLSPSAAFGLTFLMVIAMLAITLPIAFVVHRSFEYPLQQLGRRISKTVEEVAGSIPAFKRGDLGRLRP